MTPTEWVVVIGSLAAVAWVNWYFLVSGRETVRANLSSGVQEVRIRVDGGFVPSVIRVGKGRPVRLIFDRSGTAGSSDEVVLPAFGIRRFLPPAEETSIEFTPVNSGTHEFSCAMGMLRGRIEVEED